MLDALAASAIDHRRLLQLRLVIARVGEMDNARWWNTQGQLGSLGASVLKRGFPRTHAFARARSVFAVAAARCDEVFKPPHGVTLWKLPAIVEDEFEAAWEHRLAEAEALAPFFTQMEAIQGASPLEALKAFALISETEIQTVGRLKPTAEGRAVQLPSAHLSDDLLTMLAAAFALGKRGGLTVPYSVPPS